jgi:hypothetical protein
MQILKSEQMEEDARRKAASIATLAPVQELINRCKNCGEHKLEENQERDLVCVSCGACNGRAQANASLGFETVARGDLPSSVPSNEVAKTSVSDKIIRSAHRSVTNKASKAYEASLLRCNEDRADAVQDVQKRDKIIRKIHSMFANGAEGTVCAVSTDVANRFFQRAASHSAICRDSSCAAHLHKATVSSIACEAICHAIDALLGKLSYEKVHLAVEESVVLDARQLLEKSISEYKKHQNVSQSMKLAFETVLTMSSTQLCSPCVERRTLAAPRTESAEETDESEGTGAYIRRLLISLQSINALGWADVVSIERSQAFCNSPEGYEWTKPLSGWNPDLTALMIASAATSGCDDEELTTRLKKRASHDRVAWDSVLQHMSALPSVLKDPSPSTEFAP